MSNEFRDAPQQLAIAAERLLEEVAQGFDWQWTAGEPPSSVDLDAIILEKSQADYPALLETWHFLDEFIDSRWHGIAKVGGMPWDQAVAQLAKIAEGSLYTPQTPTIKQPQNEPNRHRQPLVRLRALLRWHRASPGDR